MRSDWTPEWSLGQPSFLSLVPVAAAVSILTARLCHCLYQGILPPGTLCVLYAEGQEDSCEVRGGLVRYGGALLGSGTPEREWDWNSWLPGPGGEEGQDLDFERGQGLDLERGQGPRCLRMETSSALWLDPRRGCRGPEGKLRDSLPLALMLQVTSAPPLLCQTEGGSWVLVGMALRGSRELFVAVGPEETWISQTVGEAHFLPTSGLPHRLPEGGDLCPPDIARASGSPRAALFLLLLILLVQG